MFASQLAVVTPQKLRASVVAFLSIIRIVSRAWSIASAQTKAGTSTTIEVTSGRGEAVTTVAASVWTDTKGNLWLFGGDGIDFGNKWGYLNDLWKFNPTTQRTDVD
jgi:hypothetical protein